MHRWKHRVVFSQCNLLCFLGKGLTGHFSGHHCLEPLGAFNDRFCLFFFVILFCFVVLLGELCRKNSDHRQAQQEGWSAYAK